MHQSLQFDIVEATQVAAARRAVAELCTRLGFEDVAAGRAAIVVTEIGSNLVKHAQGGQLLVRPVLQAMTRAAAAWGIELLALDKGPGMRDPVASLRDGVSTAGTAGTGLGAIRRQSAEFELHTSAAGTVLRAVIAPQTRVVPEPVQPGAVEIGAVCRAMPGETRCGDAWCVESRPGELLMLVADGLGHGPLAAQAAEAALAALDPGCASLEQMVRGIHAALRPTRGAAIGLARATRRSIEFVGIGNIVCRVRTGTVERQLVSHNGIAGHEARKIQAFSHPLGDEALVLMHSDGIATQWSLNAYPALDMRHPALIAAVLYRDHFRGRDDATIVAARIGTPARPPA